MQEAQTPLTTGTVIHKHYIVESLLGKGDFGNVYLVRDQRDKQRLFALAELINSTERNRYRFTLDYVSRAPLDRRVLPGVQYLFNDDNLGRTYLLMSYIEEPNLEILRLQQAEKRFPLDQVISIMAPVINAVDYLHRRHPPVIHRNIKPTSIIVSPRIDAPILAMLDIFKEHDSTTTPLPYFALGYGATEQYSGKVSTRTDVYGIGATCYTLLTGIVPPDALDRTTQLSNGEIDPLKPVQEVIPAIPTFIAETIQRAMSINANDRFSSVEQFRAEFVVPAGSFSPRLSSSMPSISSPLPASAPKLPDTPQRREPEDLQPVASRQTDEKLVPASLPEQRRVPRVWKPVVSLIVIALLISLGIGTGFWYHARSLPPAHLATPTLSVIRSSPTSVPTITPVPSLYPMLSGMYTGTIYDLSTNVSTNITLAGIRQNQDVISGYLSLGPNIHGSGPFKGTIDATKHLHFTVIDATGNARLSFEGVMQSATSLSGNYFGCSPIGPPQGSQCSHVPGSYGIWNVVLT